MGCSVPDGDGSVLVWGSIAAAHALSVEGRLPGVQSDAAPSFSGHHVVSIRD